MTRSSQRPVAATKRRQDRRLRLKTLHAFAALLVEDLGTVEWRQSDVRAETAGAITGISFTLTVDHFRYWRTYAKVAAERGWSLTQG